MNARRLPYRRILLPALLSLVLAAETIAVVAAVGVRPEPHHATTDSTTQLQRPATATRAATSDVPRADEERYDFDRTRLRTAPNAPADPEPKIDEAAAAAAPVRPSTSKVNTPKSISKTAASMSSGSTVSATSYSGRNRMWFPALGINRSVTSFACTSKAYPGDRVYRWGCAGKNNIYLFGHAHSVFKPLHDAYVRGRLTKGMKVTYADNNGKVSTYRIAWWKVTTPDKGAFAYAAQSRPSMTLQTCVGSKSQYRLIVRLVLDS